MSNIVMGDGTIVAPDSTPGFSWPAVFAGAVVAFAVTVFLLFLGSGFGLSLVSVPDANGKTVQQAITLGAIYFFAAQAFGLAVGGHLAGRLMGPVLETESEEMFHASTHGLAVWAVAVLATTTMIAVSGLALAGPAINAAAVMSSNTQDASDKTAMNEYWVDVLFRPAGASTAAPPGALVSAAPADALSDADARAEASRILTVGMMNGVRLSPEDHDRLASLVSQRTGLDATQASQRVDDVQTRINQQTVATAEVARRIAKYVSIWIAASLCFGALVSAGAAVSGRWQDDEVRGVTP